MGDQVQEEEYERALEALSSLISGRQRKDGTLWAHAFEMMQSYLERLGLDQELGKLSVIHVAGTKGKGSTCAMVERMLREAGYRTGLYTSPHLIDVRERIRINGEPVDRATFLRNLWWCFDKLEEKATDDSGKPAYFRFLTLLGFKIFLEAGVDVVVLEVGLGGRLDATNCVRSPIVCGVTSLGFDHMEVLGNTLPEIAREKAGIFKPGVPAFTVPQREDAAQTLVERAAAVGAPLQLVRPWEAYAGASDVALGLAGDHQKLNAALAVALTGTWEARSDAAGAVAGEAARRRGAVVAAGRLPPEYAAGLRHATWPGRGQIVHDVVDAVAAQPGSSSGTNGSLAASGVAAPAAAGSAAGCGLLPRLSFFLDGAHTAESMETCAHWFADAIANQPPAATAAAASPAAADAASANQQPQQPAGGGGLVTQRVLLFNCMQERDPQKLLQPLAQTLTERQVSIQHALFVPPDSTYGKLGASTEPINLSWQHSLRSVWDSLATRPSSSSAATAAPQLALPPLPAAAAAAAASGVGASAGGGAPAAIVAGGRSAVLPNLAVTLDWLRRCVRDVPTLRMQVLVTGSLYLVGDLLKALQQPHHAAQLLPPQQKADGGRGSASGTS